MMMSDRVIPFFRLADSRERLRPDDGMMSVSKFKDQKYCVTTDPVMFLYMQHVSIAQ